MVGDKGQTLNQKKSWSNIETSSKFVNVQQRQTLVFNHHGYINIHVYIDQNERTRYIKLSTSTVQMSRPTCKTSLETRDSSGCRVPTRVRHTQCCHILGQTSSGTRQHRIHKLMLYRSYSGDPSVSKACLSLSRCRFVMGVLLFDRSAMLVGQNKYIKF